MGENEEEVVIPIVNSEPTENVDDNDNQSVSAPEPGHPGKKT